MDPVTPPPENLDALFEPAAPVVDPAAPVAPTVDPAAPAVADPAKPASPATPLAWTPEAFDAWYNTKHPENPDGIVNISDWRTSRTTAAKLTRTLFTTEQELAEAKTALDAAKAAGGPVMAETEAVRALQLELETERQSKATALAEWEARKAKDALEGNHAFLAEHDGKRVAIRNEALALAKEADIPEEVVTAALGASSRYQLEKALEGVTDQAAKGLLATMGADFIRLGAEREAAMKNPIDHLKRWQDYEQATQGHMARGFQKQALDTWAGSIPDAMKTLGDEPFFKTATGKIQLEGLQTSIMEGRLPNVVQSIAALAKAEASDFYREAWSAGRTEIATQKTEIARLTAELAKYAAADPSAITTGLPKTPPSASGFDVESWR